MYLCTKHKATRISTSRHTCQETDANGGTDGLMDRYLGEIDVEEYRFLGAGHLNPVPADGLLRVSSCLHRRRGVSRHVEADGELTYQSEGLIFSREYEIGLRIHGGLASHESVYIYIYIYLNGPSGTAHQLKINCEPI
jgi:hypothetical protein